jgi:uroporphyrinogen-III synthase
MPRLGVTRSRAQLAELAQEAASRGIEVIPLPVIATQTVAFDWPQNVDPKNVNWVVFSSAVGVTAFFERLKQLGLRLADSTLIAAVGDKTAGALQRFGHTANHVCAKPYGHILFEELAVSIIRPGQTVLYARAADVNFDPAELLAQHDIHYVSVVCYETIPQKVSEGVVQTLSDSDFILFTAPSTVRSYHEQFGPPTAKAIAIGNSTGSEMWKLGWAGFSWLSKPDINLVLEYI